LEKLGSIRRAKHAFFFKNLFIPKARTLKEKNNNGIACTIKYYTEHKGKKGNVS